MAVDRLRDHTIVILDTNALYMPFQFKLNLDSELSRLLGVYEIIIPTCVLSEASSLERHEKFGKPALKLALSKIQPRWYKDLEAELDTKQDSELGSTGDRGISSVDRVILTIALAIKGIVVTNDKIFLKELKAHGVRTISLKGRKYLKFNDEE